MGLIRADCIVEASTTTGTGALTLTGPVVGFKAFSDVMTSPSDTCYYLIEAIDGSGNRTGEWESGLGTYSGVNTLTRTTVHAGSNGTSLVNLSAGTKRAMICLTATASSFKGALVKKVANLTGQNLAAAAVAVTWDTEDYDTNTFHDTTTNTDRMTIPSGVCGKVRLKGQVTFGNLVPDSWMALTIYKNGVADYAGCGRTVTESGSAAPTNYVETAVVSVVATDYFQLYVQSENDTSADITAASSWFAIEVVE